jgi:hypothetical protein
VFEPDFAPVAWDEAAFLDDNALMNWDEDDELADPF